MAMREPRLNKDGTPRKRTRSRAKLGEIPPVQLRDVDLTADDLRAAVRRFELQHRSAQDERIYVWLVTQHRLAVLREAYNDKEADDGVASEAAGIDLPAR